MSELTTAPAPAIAFQTGPSHALAIASSSSSDLSLSMQYVYSKSFTRDRVDDKSTSTGDDMDGGGPDPSFEVDETRVILEFAEGILSSASSGGEGQNPSLLPSLSNTLQNLSTSVSTPSLSSALSLLSSIVSLQSLLSTPRTSPALVVDWLRRTADHYDDDDAYGFYSDLLNPANNAHLDGLLSSPEPEFYTPTDHNNSFNSNNETYVASDNEERSDEY